MAKLSAAEGKDLQLRIQLLGEFAVWLGSEKIPEERWRLRRTRSLVKLLALAAGHRMHRDQVADTLWPESDPDASANNFHQTLHAARHALEPYGPACLRLEEGLLSLTGARGQPPQVDVEQFEAAAAAARGSPDPLAYQSALNLYPGDLLPEDLYDEWILPRREALRRRYLGLLLELALVYETRQAYPPAVETLERLLFADRANEEAHIALMRLYALSGKPAQALRQYQALREALRADLETDPCEAATRLYEDIQAHRFPPARVSPPDVSSHHPPPHNLPVHLTSFIGREAQIAEVARLVTTHHLVTLTGAGGMGKTRLALQAAKELTDDFPDGVWLVDLAPVIDPAFVPDAVASIFEVHSATGQRLVQTLREYFASKCLLLILDNCEHVIDAVAELSASLLQGCPGLSILTTSREILDVEGEFIFRCPSLTLPDFSPMHPSTFVMKQAEASEAVQMFVDRAAAAAPGFCLTEKNAAVLIKICRCLDGIPLAIELAAARLRISSLEEMAGHLDDVFGFLTGSRRSAQPRHKTLKALIEWSYQLLSPGEQALLRQLSVFAGGWTLPAAEALAIGNGIEPGEALDRMGQLVDKSLILVETTQAGGNRYHILETIRQYANEKLVEAGEYRMARDHHLAFFSHLAQQADPPDSNQYTGPVWAQRLINEVDNIRVALEWSLETNIELGLRLGISFYEVAPMALLIETGNWLERLLEAEATERAKPGIQSDEVQYRLLRGEAFLYVGMTSYLWGMRDRSERALRRSVAIFEAIGEPAEYWIPASRMELGTLLICTDPEQARLYLENSRDTVIRRGERDRLPGFDRKLVALYLYTGDLNPARQFAEEDLQVCREMNFLAPGASEWAGHAAFFMGDFDRAIAYYQQAQEEACQLQEFYYAAYQAYLEGCVALAQGNAARVLQISEELSIHGIETGHTGWFFSADTLLALLEWTQGAHDRAVQRSEEGLLRYQAIFLSYRIPFVYVLGRVSLARGELAKAAHFFHQMDGMTTTPIMRWKAYSLQAFGLLAAAQSGQKPKMAERAAVLFGAQEKLFAWLPILQSPFEKSEYERARTLVKAILGEEAFAAAWGKGQGMSHQQAFTLALDETGENLI